MHCLALSSANHGCISSPWTCFLVALCDKDILEWKTNEVDPQGHCSCNSRFRPGFVLSTGLCVLFTCISFFRWSLLGLCIMSDFRTSHSVPLRWWKCVLFLQKRRVQAANLWWGLLFQWLQSFQKIKPESMDIWNNLEPPNREQKFSQRTMQAQTHRRQTDAHQEKPQGTEIQLESIYAKNLLILIHAKFWTL